MSETESGVRATTTATTRTRPACSTAWATRWRSQWHDCCSLSWTSPDLTDDYELYVPDWEDADAFDIEFEDGVTIGLIDQFGMAEMRPRLWRVGPGEKLSYQTTAERRAGSGVVHATTTPTTATTLAPRNAAW